MLHLREERARHDVDVVAELGGRSMLAFEFEADARRIVMQLGI